MGQADLLAHPLSLFGASRHSSSPEQWGNWTLCGRHIPLCTILQIKQPARRGLLWWKFKTSSEARTGINEKELEMVGTAQLLLREFVQTRSRWSNNREHRGKPAKLKQRTPPWVY